MTFACEACGRATEVTVLPYLIDSSYEGSLCRRCVKELRRHVDVDLLG